MKDGFIKAAAGTIDVVVADVQYNTEQILARMREADAAGVNLLTLPELCLTGYTCGDLFFSDCLLGAVEPALARIVEASKNLYPVTAVGLPLRFGGKLYNCAAVVHAVAGQHDLHAGVGLHQRNQELGGPLFVDTQRLRGVDHGGDLGDRGVGVSVPNGLAGRIRDIEQLVQKQHRLALGGQVERQQTLIGFHGDTGQIPHAFGVADDHLGQALCAQCGTNPVNTFHFHKFDSPFVCFPTYNR